MQLVIPYRKNALTYLCEKPINLENILICPVILTFSQIIVFSFCVLLFFFVVFHLTR